MSNPIDQFSAIDRDIKQLKLLLVKKITAKLGVGDVSCEEAAAAPGAGWSITNAIVESNSNSNNFAKNPLTALFKYALGADVKLRLSGERGVIKGRADFSTGAENSYFVVYKDATGRQVQSWCDESDLLPAPDGFIDSTTIDS